MSLQLQTRDFQIFKYLFENRAVTLEQIRQLAFAERSRSALVKRVNNLCLENYIKPSVFEYRGKRKRYFSILAKSFPFISNSWPFEINKPHFKSESPAHDARLGDVRTRLEILSSFISFFPENLLQSSDALAQDYRFQDLVKNQADGALVVNDKSQKPHVFGIELEISKKAPDRYLSKLSSYYLAGGISGVIYICANQEIINSLVKIDKEIRLEKKSILHFALEENVLAKSEKLYFQNAKEHGISFY